MIHLNNLRFQYDGPEAFSLRLKDFQVAAGTSVFLDGPSGSGKSTVLNLMAGLTSPDQGTVTLLGTNIHQLTAPMCDQFRADHMGIIFQSFNLVPYLSVIENIMLPCVFSKKRQAHAVKTFGTLLCAARQWFQDIGIDSARYTAPVTQLSVGQQQRVAIARALIGAPELIMADEPTSALDSLNKDQFMTLLFNETQKVGATLLFVSHDTTLKAWFKRHVAMTDLLGKGTE
ncbi:MAG: ABC transporter ATP-binding protein [Candidatus Marinamargulisbacteria bacterium]